MSEYHTVKTQFKDKNVLIDSLKELGIDPIVHDKNVELVGYGNQKKRACIVIPKGQIKAYWADIGFEQQSDEFVMHVDDYGSFNFSKFKQIYVKNKVLKQIRVKKKYKLKKQEERDGKIRLRLSIK